MELAQGWTLYVTRSALSTITEEEGEQTEGAENPVLPSFLRPGRRVVAGSLVAKSDASNRMLSTEVARYRAVVERTFRSIKTWGYSNNRHMIQKYQHRVQEAIHAICGLVNWNVRHKSQK